MGDFIPYIRKKACTFIKYHDIIIYVKQLSSIIKGVRIIKK